MLNCITACEKNIKQYRMILCIFISNVLYIMIMWNGETHQVPAINDLHTSTGMHTIILSSAALDGIQCQRRAGECKFVLFGQHWCVHV